MATLGAVVCRSLGAAASSLSATSVSAASSLSLPPRGAGRSSALDFLDFLLLSFCLSFSFPFPFSFFFFFFSPFVSSLSLLASLSWAAGGEGVASRRCGDGVARR